MPLNQIVTRYELLEKRVIYFPDEPFPLLKAITWRRAANTQSSSGTDAPA